MDQLSRPQFASNSRRLAGNIPSLLCALCVLCGSSPAANAADPPPTWGKDVGPLFKKYCMPCHNAATHTEDVVLESYASAMKGGEHGKIIVPGKSSRSEVVLLIEGKKKPKMPPAGAGPTKKEIARLRAWIDAGAKPDPKPKGATRRGDAETRGRGDGEIAGVPGPRPRVAVPGPITSLAFSPDGRMVAVGSYREVRLMETSSRRLIQRLAGPVASVTAVAFTPDGRTLAAAGGAPGQFGEITLWHLAPSHPRTLALSRPRTRRGHDDAIYSLSFSPDGKTVAAASYDRMLSLWPVAGGEPRMLKDHIDAVYAVAFSPDGRRLASAAGDRMVKVWDVATGKRLFTLSESTAELYSVAFHPSGRELAAGGADKMLRTWKLDGDNGALLRSAFAHDGAILRVAYSRDGKRLVTAGEDRAVKLWDAAALTEQRVLAPQPDWPLALAFAPDARRLAVGRYDGTWALYSDLLIH